MDFSRIENGACAIDHHARDAALIRIGQWLSGGHVNTTENRPAMHMALRASENSPLPSEYVQPALAERERQKAFINALDADNILHLGMGGSDFGPRLLVNAMGSTAPIQRNVHFLSTLTPETIRKTASTLNPQKDMIFLASKSFTTDEILYITQVLLRDYGWSTDRIVALTAMPDKAKEMGITDDRIFPFWSWVGGRFSSWSSIGLPIAAAFGWDHFDAFLKGGEEIDHDLYTNLENSMAFRLAVICHQQRKIMNRSGLAIFPYHYGLKLLPAYLQQLIMESNGKPGSRTAPIVFGQIGTEFQHSFGQYLHQGPDNTLSLFIDVGGNDTDDWAIEARRRLSANAHAQADTLWQGASPGELYRHLPGGRPSVFLSMSDLSPRSMGNLLALFEHATVIDAFLSGINPFDQWGVEAGKLMAQKRLNKGS